MTVAGGVARMKRNIFLSMGKPYLPKYEAFAGALKRHLEANDLVVYEIPGRTFDDPIGEVQQQLDRCDGAIIVCFERIYGATAKEFRNGSSPLTHKPFNVTTVWNHMEGAMAKANGLPLLILAEPGCKDEGILHHSVKLDIVRMEMEEADLRAGDFPTMFRGWLKHVNDHTHAGLIRDPGSHLDALKDTPILKIIGALRGRHWALVITFSAAIFGLGAVLSRLLPGANQ
jgi:hypothetical protein